MCTVFLSNSAVPVCFSTFPHVINTVADNQHSDDDRESEDDEECIEDDRESSEDDRESDDDDEEESMLQICCACSIYGTAQAQRHTCVRVGVLNNC